MDPGAENGESPKRVYLQPTNSEAEVEGVEGVEGVAWWRQGEAPNAQVRLQANETGREETTGNTRTKHAATAHTLLMLHTLHTFPVNGNRNALICFLTPC